MVAPWRCMHVILFEAFILWRAGIRKSIFLCGATILWRAYETKRNHGGSTEDTGF